MPYIVKHLPNLAIAEITLTGDISGNDLREVTSECITLQKLTGIKRFLVDANGWEVVASFLDVYEIAETQYQAEGLHRHSHIAVVLPTALSAQVAANFYETVCQNRGWNAVVHRNSQSALDWLMGAQEPG
jgi:hypothetical protein